MTSNIINEDVSALKIATLVLVKILMVDGAQKTRAVLSCVTRQLEGHAVVKDHKLMIASTLLSFCEILASELVDGRKSPQNDCLAGEAQALQLKVLEIMWGIESIDDMHLLVKQTQTAILHPLSITQESKYVASSRSLIGRFVQKIAISMKLLQFDESSQLYLSICQFRHTSEGLYRKLIKSTAISDTNTSIPDDNFRESTPSGRSLNDKHTVSSDADDAFYRILNSQLAESLILDPGKSHLDSNVQHVTTSDLEVLIDTQIELLEKFGTETPPELKSILRQMAKVSAQSTSISSTEVSSPASSHFLWYLERLHSGDYHGAFNALHQYFDYMVSQGSKYFYHFALISKASLHQHFGEDEKALNSIEEAISVARENKDNKSLTYVLSWLFDFMRRKPSLWETQSLQQIKSEERLLDFLVKKSSAVSLSLAAISYRFETEYLMTTKSMEITYFESLLKAVYISLNDNPATFIGTCHTSLKLWHKVGCFHLSTFYCDLGLRLAEKYGSTQDSAEFSIRRSFLAQNYDLCDANSEIFTESVHVDSSNAFQKRSVQLEALVIRIEGALRKGRLSFATELLNTLTESEMTNQELLLAKVELMCLILISSQNYSEALNLIGYHLGALTFNNSALGCNTSHEIKLNILKSHILISSGAPLRAFSLLIQQVQSAKNLGLRALIAEGIALLLRLLNDVGQPGDVKDLGVSILPMIFTTGNINLVSAVCYELARSCSALMEQIESRDAEMFNNFLNFLSISISGFKRISHLEMLSRCFELEKHVASVALRHGDGEASNAMSEFAVHSQKGIEILQRRVDGESAYGYL